MNKRETRAVDPLLLAPILRTRLGYWLVVTALSAVVAWGLYAWVHQLREGLGVTGMNRPIYWGLYISNFVFFIGISHAGTLISAILRVAGAEWRRPITRAAEAITVFALALALTQIFADMGRPDRLLNLILRGRFQSPLLWDITSVGMYITGSITYLYLPLIPDLAILRDQLPATTPAWRQWLYRTLALGWHGGSEQRRRLEKAITIMAILIIPLAISVHTVVSWIFGMTLQPMWHSTIFGPYFVIGAIYSGIATILIAMAVIRKAFHLEGYLKPLHFRYLGLLLITFNALWFYFTFAEYLTTGYGGVPHEMAVFNTKLRGEYQIVFWGMVAAMAAAFVVLLLPHLPAPRRMRLPAFRPRYALATGVAALAVAIVMFSQAAPVTAQVGLALTPTVSQRLLWLLGILLALFAASVLPALRRNIIAGTVVASLLVDLGMWLERFTIVVPTETRPMLLYSIGIYRPTWVEWSITAAALAGFVLIYALFVKLFPIISIWEVQEAPEAIPATVERLRSYLPETVASSGASEGGS
ncbi:MAG: NrfD/PsrC family molybdoenzyme membrane anchor subunit [Anaerolineae bacterium]